MTSSSCSSIRPPSLISIHHEDLYETHHWDQTIYGRDDIIMCTSTSVHKWEKNPAYRNSRVFQVFHNRSFWQNEWYTNGFKSLYMPLSTTIEYADALAHYRDVLALPEFAQVIIIMQLRPFDATVQRLLGQTVRGIGVEYVRVEFRGADLENPSNWTMRIATADRLSISAFGDSECRWGASEVEEQLEAAACREVALIPKNTSPDADEYLDESFLLADFCAQVQKEREPTRSIYLYVPHFDRDHLPDNKDAALRKIGWLPERHLADGSDCWQDVADDMCGVQLYVGPATTASLAETILRRRLDKLKRDDGKPALTDICLRVSNVDHTWDVDSNIHSRFDDDTGDAEQEDAKVAKKYHHSRLLYPRLPLQIWAPNSQFRTSRLMLETVFPVVLALCTLEWHDKIFYEVIDRLPGTFRLDRWQIMRMIDGVRATTRRILAKRAQRSVAKKSANDDDN